MKESMKSKDAMRLRAIRAIQTAIKQKEVDDRSLVDGVNYDMAVDIMVKLVKSRKESAKLYEEAGRGELAAAENEEIALIQGYMPKQMGEAEIADIVGRVVEEVGALSIKDMGKVMGKVKPLLQGKADIGMVGAMIKAKLGGGGGGGGGNKGGGSKDKGKV
jgi:uncharacterized protein YqeY